MSLSINQVKSGLTLLVDNNVFVVQDYNHVKPGKGSAFVRVKLKNMITGAVLERTYKTDDKLEEAFVEQRRLVYQYRSQDFYHFMDQENYEEVVIHQDLIKDEVLYLKDDLEVLAFYFDKKLLRVNLPTFIPLKVTETEPGIKGDTAKSGTKSAKLETGLVVQVPLFINIGDTLKIDTRTGSYLERT